MIIILYVIRFQVFEGSRLRIFFVFFIIGLHNYCEKLSEQFSIMFIT